MLGLCLIAQGFLYLITGQSRATNPIYQLFAVVTRPVIRLARAITPKAIIERHVPFVAFLLLFWLWIFLAWAKRYLAG